MSGQKYQCYGKTLRPPENGDLVCSSATWIVKEKVKCKVSCEVGKPTFETVECKKDIGWRPTHKVQCEGVGPGVIIGVLLGGLAAVVLIAIGYAKYKQYQKKKRDKANPPPPKGSIRRPGAENRPGGKKLITGVENGRSHVPTAVINKGYADQQTVPLSTYQPSESSRESIPSKMPRRADSFKEREVPPKPGQRQPPPEMHHKSKDPGNYYQQRPKSAHSYSQDRRANYYEDNMQYHAGGASSMPVQYVGYDMYEQQPPTSGYGSASGYDSQMSYNRPPTSRSHTMRSGHYDRAYNVPT